MNVGDGVKQRVTQRAPPSDPEADGDRATSAAALLDLGKHKTSLPSPAAEVYKAKLERDVQKALDQAYRDHEEAMDALVRERDQLR
jgi:IS4 transposase